MKNRITHAWDAIPDPQLRRKVKEMGERNSRTFALLLKQETVPASIQTLVHVHPFDNRKAFRHHILFLGRLPVMVIHTDLIPR